jgi:transposase
VGRKATSINVSNATLESLILSMSCTPTKEGYDRLEGISFLYKGYSKEEVADLKRVTVRAVQSWVKSFNDSGIDGVLGSKRTGRPRKIEPCVFASKYKEEFLSSSKTAICFHGNLVSDYKEQICYSTLLNYLHEQGLSRIVGRPECQQRDQEKRRAFIESLNFLVKEEAEIWFSDEVGFEGNPKPRRKWVKKGEKLSNPFYKLHLRSNVIGAANPSSGEFFSHVVPYVDSQVFQHYLDEFNKVIKIQPSKKIVMVLDNASWHTKALRWGHVEPLFLPPYSPDFNPIEQLWKLVKDRFFNGWYAENIEQLDDRVCQAMKHLIQNKHQVRTTASMEYLVD